MAEWLGERKVGDNDVWDYRLEDGTIYPVLASEAVQLGLEHPDNYLTDDAVRSVNVPDIDTATDADIQQHQDRPRVKQWQYDLVYPRRKTKPRQGVTTVERIKPPVDVQIGEAQIEPPLDVQIGEAQFEPPVDVEIGDAQLEPEGGYPSRVYDIDQITQEQFDETHNPNPRPPRPKPRVGVTTLEQPRATREISKEEYERLAAAPGSRFVSEQEFNKIAGYETVIEDQQSQISKLQEELAKLIKSLMGGDDGPIATR